MRNWINLFEAAFGSGSTYWIHPETGDIVPASDHGQAVMDDPGRFGIDWRTESAMERAFPEELEDGYYSDEEDEDTERPEPGPIPDELEGPGWHGIWGRNDAWEQLAMNRGWIRVGEGGRGHGSYVSAATPELIWFIAKHLQKNGSIGTVFEAELSSAQYQGFFHLSPETVVALVKAGPKRAGEFLSKRG